jgi:hypothetical protein
MKKYFLLMFVLLLALCSVALAQTATDPQLLWGWNPTIVSAVMGVITSILSSILMHVHWETRVKQWFVFGLSVVVTVGVGIFSKNISLSGINAGNVGEIAATVFTMTHLTYLAFSKPLNGLQENVNAGKAAAPALPK